MSNKRKRNVLTMKDKMAILNMLDSGEHMVDVAAHFDISRSTIYDIKSRRSKIIQFENIADKRKKARFGKYPEVDFALHEWFLEERAKNTTITGDMLKDKAKEIYFNFTGKEFKASAGWLERYNKRFGITFNTPRVSGEKASLKSHNENIVANFAKTFEEKVEELGVVSEQLYSIDASGLLLNILSTKTSILTKEAPEKNRKERITFLPCSNATGTHKFDLLVIGKETEKLENVSLPVCYKTQPNNWVTKDVFTEWFHDEFVPGVRSFMCENDLPEKALLVLDAAPGYPEEHYLKSNDWLIQAMFLPANCGHLIQPTDQNIIERIKSRYRNKIILDVISKGGDVKHKLKELTLTDVLLALADAWNSISSNTIRRSWNKIMPNIKVSTDKEDDENAHGDLLEALRESGINNQEISAWLKGTIEVINYISDEGTSNDTTRTIKSEDPLILYDSSPDSYSVNTLLPCLESVKTEVHQDLRQD